MEKDHIIIIEDRGLISVFGEDAANFLQNIITNDVKKVSITQTIFSGIFTPQGKYLYEFFVIKSKNGFYIDCDSEILSELLDYLKKYKLRSKVEFKDLSSEYVIGIISNDKFKEIQKLKGKSSQTVHYKSNPCFKDTRSNSLGARMLSSIRELHFIIKELSLKITNQENYFRNAYENGIPTRGLKNLQNNLFGLEANFEELSAIDFKKGCYIGQENTARMKLKNKLRKKLVPIKVSSKIEIGNDVIFNKVKIGKILIDEPYPFALIKIYDPNFSDFKEHEILINDKKARII